MLKSTQYAAIAGRLKNRLERKDLVAAWEEVLDRAPSPNVWPTTDRLIARLAEADRDAVDRLLQVATPLINDLNDFVGRVDDRLISTREFAQRAPELHLDLLVDLTLLEPVVWHQSLVAGRGRWGYGVLSLRTALMSLRHLSPSPAVRSEISVEMFGSAYLISRALGSITRMASYPTRRLVPPRITVRTKIKQNREARRRGSRLVTAGYELVDPRRHTVDW
ncbi:MAG: hypothetical protein WBA45_01930 [Microthrixaceae bacterium]